MVKIKIETLISVSKITAKEKKRIKGGFTDAFSLRSEWTSYWDSIGDYASIVKRNYDNRDSSLRGQDLDTELNDPSSLIAVEQATDSIHGILVGDTKSFFTLEPTQSIIDIEGSKEKVQKFYNSVSNEALYHMNRPRSNFSTSIKQAIRDYVEVGNGGVGSFYDRKYLKKKVGNILNHRSYGVDIIAIDEGESGIIEYVYIKYLWKISRIINTFAVVNGELNKRKFAKLPKKWQDAWTKNTKTQRFNVAFALMPNSEFETGKLGKLGHEYLGFWFDDDTNTFFELEFYKTRPIPIVRGAVRRAEIYGRSNLGLVISSVRMLNYIMGDMFEAVEKIVKPTLGMYNGALVGSKIIDTSSNVVNVLNPTGAGKTPPIFPLFEVGDIVPAIQFLVPYLKEMISTGMKIDNLLDFNSKKEMTATETLRRYAIRSKAILGMLTKIKDELLNPIIDRDIELLMTAGVLGVNPQLKKEEAKKQVGLDREFRLIPESVSNHIKEGKAWYTIKYNTELSTLAKGRDFESLSNFLLILQAVANFSPDVILAIDWYKLLQSTKEVLNLSSEFLLSKKDFLAEKKKEQEKLTLTQGSDVANTISQTNKNQSEAKKNEQETRDRR